MPPAAINWQEEMEKIRAAATLADLDALELHLLGRKQGIVTDTLKELGALSPEERKEKGKVLNAWKEKIVVALDERRTELQSASLSSIAATDRIDPTLSLPQKEHGHLHPIPAFIADVEEVFRSMGFDTAEGPEIESEETNFTMLNIPETHPARDMQDTFWIKDKPKHVLRTHTSPVQIRYMRTHKPPFRMICPGRTYRKDADATHSPMFHQFEGLMVGKDISLANMKAVMITAMQSLISPDIEFRFRASYFPFVEPGLEVDMRWKGGDKEDSLRQAQDSDSPTGNRWLEVVGCGMVHPQVLRNGGIDPDLWSGFAFGFGIDRLLMIKHKIPDLRSLYENDIRFLRQF